jgi:hypothetical protein
MSAHCRRIVCRIMGEENKGRVSAGQKILERAQTEENLDSNVP